MGLIELAYPHAKRKPRAVIFDVDGTLTSTKWRVKYLEEKPPNWPLFHGSMVLDAPIEGNIEMLRRYKARGDKIILITLRPERFRAATEKWMKDHDVPFDEMYLRPPKDYSIGKDKKRDILQREVLPKNDVFAAYDDFPDNITMFEENGVPGVQVFDPGLDPLPGEPIEDPKYAKSRLQTLNDLFGIANPRPTWQEYKAQETRVWVPPHMSVSGEGHPYHVKGYWMTVGLSAVGRVARKIRK